MPKMRIQKITLMAVASIVLANSIALADGIRLTVRPQVQNDAATSRAADRLPGRARAIKAVPSATGHVAAMAVRLPQLKRAVRQVPALQMRLNRRGAAKRLAAPTLNGGPPTNYPDLYLIPHFEVNVDNLPEGFPGHSFCYNNPGGGTPHSIKFDIHNNSLVESGAFQTNIFLPTAGAVAPIAIPSIPAGGQYAVTQALPPSCYTKPYSGTCEFSIKLDTHFEIVEASETNNEAESFCVSPAT